MNSLNGQFVTGTFTADATSQVLNVSYTTGISGRQRAHHRRSAGGGPDITAPTGPRLGRGGSPVPHLTHRPRQDQRDRHRLLCRACRRCHRALAAQVKAGTDSANSPALKSGSLALTANTEATAPVTGLTTDTTYDVYFVGRGRRAQFAGRSFDGQRLIGPFRRGHLGCSCRPSRDAADIVSTGVTGLAGANFGITTGTTTIVNNGAGETGGVDVEFKSLRSGQNATLVERHHRGGGLCLGELGPSRWQFGRYQATSGLCSIRTMESKTQVRRRLTSPCQV